MHSPPISRRTGGGKSTGDAMAEYEYKVVPAPTRGERAKGIKRPADRFANTLTRMMNDWSAEGWEYLRAETLPCEHRKGVLGGTTTIMQTMLVFRRARDAPAEPAAPAHLSATPESPPLRATPEPEDAPAPTPPLRARRDGADEAGEDTAAPEIPGQARHEAEDHTATDAPAPSGDERH
ncbi:DUF4177 domain-containing protein [Rhodobacteraceae bacterium WD3A24]|nr:DUF4177 domain-containing protein [Rhodobacteraceae bacterium WD3A24]